MEAGGGGSGSAAAGCGAPAEVPWAEAGAAANASMANRVGAKRYLIPEDFTGQARAFVLSKERDLLGNGLKPQSYHTSLGRWVTPGQDAMTCMYCGFRMGEAEHRCRRCGRTPDDTLMPGAVVHGALAPQLRSAPAETAVPSGGQTSGFRVGALSLTWVFLITGHNAHNPMKG